MAGSLQDQLLKAGLATKKKAKQAEREKQKNAKQQRTTGDFVDKAKANAEASRQAKKEKDLQLNLEQKAQSDKKAIAAQIKQLIQINAIDRENGENDFNFVDGKKVKRIQVTTQLHGRLSRGQLTICKLGDQYIIVSNVVADKVAQRDERYLVHRAETVVSDQPEEDDPYADYQIPDDLMW